MARKNSIEKMLGKAKNVFVYGQVSDHEGQYFKVSKTAVKKAIEHWNNEEFDLNRFVLRDIKSIGKSQQDLYIN